MLVIALGGCLTDGALAQGTSTENNQRVDRSVQSVEESSRISEQLPAPQGDGAGNPEEMPGNPNDVSQGAAASVQHQTEPACGPRCQAAEQREKDDLTAQQSMADATEEIVDLTLKQIVVGAIGLILLIATIVYTHLSYCLTARTSRQQLRAYVHLSTTEFEYFGPEYLPNIRLGIKNFGQTPAREIRTKRSSLASGNKSPDLSNPGAESRMHDLAPNQESQITITLGYPTWEIQKSHVLRSDWDFYVFGEILYKDVFGEDRKTEFRLKLNIDDAGIEYAVLSACPEGNTAT